MKQSKAFITNSVMKDDGLHIVLPKSVGRYVFGNKDKQLPMEIPVYGVVSNGSIQLSYEKFSLSIPAIALTSDSFIPNQEQ
jgi:hypothetical protein